jgi:(1->4)-alpha-D-glucan 1-alpha-D-glucosylmutase
LREAKLATDWDAPNAEYEDAAKAFLNAIMEDAAFTAEAARFARRIGAPGAVNGLAQTLLKLTVPGVPDFYQGTEFWDQSLVDPDNRRPVDFAARSAALAADETPVAAAAHWRDGHVKQAVIRRALALRREAPALFARGDYQPIEVIGAKARHVVAFARTHDGANCVVVAPRLPGGLLEPAADSVTIPTENWHDTALVLPDALLGSTLRDRLSDEGCPSDRRILLRDLLARLPIALLTSG